MSFQPRRQDGYPLKARSLLFQSPAFHSISYACNRGLPQMPPQGDPYFKILFSYLPFVWTSLSHHALPQHFASLSVLLPSKSEPRKPLSPLPSRLPSMNGGAAIWPIECRSLHPQPNTLMEGHEWLHLRFVVFPPGPIFFINERGNTGYIGWLRRSYARLSSLGAGRGCYMVLFSPLYIMGPPMSQLR